MEQSAEPWKVRDRMPHRFVPWPIAAEHVTHAIDPGTPIAEWGAECGRGFTGNNGTNHQRKKKRTRKTNSTGD
jgi:hypothetical protein